MQLPLLLHGCGVCSYILWKSVARHLPTPEQRTLFCSEVGEQLLQQLMPQQRQQLQAAAAGGLLKQQQLALNDTSAALHVFWLKTRLKLPC